MAEYDVLYFEEETGVPQQPVVQTYQQAHTILEEFASTHGGNAHVSYVHNVDSSLYPLAAELQALIPGYAPRNTGFSVAAKVELPKKALPEAQRLCALLQRDLNMTLLSIPKQ